MLYLWEVIWYDTAMDERGGWFVAESEEEAIKKCLIKEKKEDSDFDEEYDVHNIRARKFDQADGYEILIGDHII